MLSNSLGAGVQGAEEGRHREGRPLRGSVPLQFLGPFSGPKDRQQAFQAVKAWAKPGKPAHSMLQPCARNSGSSRLKGTGAFWATEKSRLVPNSPTSRTGATRMPASVRTCRGCRSGRFNP